MSGQRQAAREHGQERVDRAGQADADHHHRRRLGGEPGHGDPCRRGHRTRAPGKNHATTQLIDALVILVVGSFVMGVANAYRQGRRFGPIVKEPIFRLGAVSGLIGLVTVVCVSLLMLEAILILTGLAAGVK